MDVVEYIELGYLMYWLVRVCLENEEKKLNEFTTLQTTDDLGLWHVGFSGNLWQVFWFQQFYESSRKRLTRYI